MQNIISFLQFNQYNADVIGLSIGLYLLFIWVAVVIWVIRDITMRSRNIFVVIFVTIFVLIGNIAGLIIYLLIRPESTIEESSNKQMFYASVLDQDINSCHNCQILVRNDFKYCPNCSEYLQQTCPHCSTRVNPNWNFCIKCTQPLKTDLNKINIFIKIGTGISEYYRVALNNLNWYITQIIKHIQFGYSEIGKNIRDSIQNLNTKPAVSTLAAKIESKDKDEKVEKLEKIEAVKPEMKTAPKKSSKKDISKKNPKPKKKKTKKKVGRGRPKGSSDSKPRKRRADAGKKRGSYNK